MDHHCAFLNNCVGHGNLHYFIRMLLFAVMATSYEWIGCLCALKLDLASYRTRENARRASQGLGELEWAGGQWSEVLTNELWTEETRALLLLMFVAGWVILFCGVLLGIQLANLVRGLTFLEQCKDPQPTQYDLGSWMHNVRAVFGRSLARHLLPLPCAPVGDGIHFPTGACGCGTGSEGEAGDVLDDHPGERAHEA